MQCMLSQRDTVCGHKLKDYEIVPDRPSLFQLVAERGHGSLHALILLSLTLEDRSLGLDLLDDLIKHSAHSPGLLLLQLKLRLTLRICIVQLNTGTAEEESKTCHC